MEPLFGRADVLEKLTELNTAGTRCTVIVGPPGVGKSALVHHWAPSVDAMTCALQERTSQRGLLYALAQALELDADGAALGERAQSVLAMRGGVLVLDGAEKIESLSAGRMIEAWLAVAPQLQVVLTSRRVLEIDGAELIRLPPLTLPSHDEDLEAPAAALFVRRALEASPNLDIESMRGDVVEIVRRLDGLPLGIELAARSLQRISAARLARRLRGDLALVRRERLDAALHESWEALQPDEQQLLAAVSVLAGSFDAEVAEAAASSESDVFAILEQLVGHSLVQRKALAGGGARYSLLSPIRRSAVAHCADPAVVRARVAAYYATLDPEDLLPEDIPGLESAIDWVLEHERTVEAASSLLRALASLHFPEATANAAERVVERLEPGARPADVEVRCLGGRAAMRCQQWDLAARLLTEAKDMAQDPVGRAQALAIMGRMDLFRRDVDAARSWIEQIDTAADLGHELLAEIENLKGGIHLFSGELKLSLEHQEKALGHARQLKDRRVLAQTLTNLSSVRYQLGAYQESIELGRRAVEVARETRSSVWEGRALVTLASILVELQQPDAEEVLREALDVCARQGEPTPASHARFKLAHLLRENGELSEARRQTLIALEHAPKVYRGTLTRTLAMIAHQEGDVAQSLEHYDRAITVQEEGGLGHILATSYLLRAAAQLELEDLESSLADLQRPEVKNAKEAYELVQKMLALVSADGQQEQSAAVELLKEALAAESKTRSLELRFLRGRAEHLVQELNKRTQVIRIARDGSGFTPPGGEPCSLARRRALAAVLGALASKRHESPGRTVSADDLCSAGWPGERMNRSSARRRLYVTIAELRKMGLKSALLRHGTGYLLDPDTTDIE